MENQNEPIEQSQRDLTLPLFLTGIATTVVCAGLCAVLCVALYLSRDFISNDLAPALGPVEPTPELIICPPVPSTWEEVIIDDFSDNSQGWPTETTHDAFPIRPC